MELAQLEELEAVARFGTLSAAAEHLNASQSSLTRSMQKLEAELGVDLFDRTRNRLALNDAGRIAVDHARLVLRDAAALKEALGDYARDRSTLRLGSCAPAPLWRIIAAVAEKDPSTVVRPERMDERQLEGGLVNGTLDFAVLPGPLDLPQAVSVPVMIEDLFASLPPEHPLAARDAIALSELDGETFLVYAGIAGFWRNLCDKHLPHAHFIVQDDYVVFSQLARTSPLPSFATNASPDGREHGERRIVPLVDDDVHVTFHLCALDRPGFRWMELLRWLGRRLA